MEQCFSESFEIWQRRRRPWIEISRDWFCCFRLPPRDGHRAAQLPSSQPASVWHQRRAEIEITEPIIERECYFRSSGEYFIPLRNKPTSVQTTPPCSNPGQSTSEPTDRPTNDDDGMIPHTSSTESYLLG